MELNREFTKGENTNIRETFLKMVTILRHQGDWKLIQL